MRRHLLRGAGALLPSLLTCAVSAPALASGGAPASFGLPPLQAAPAPSAPAPAAPTTPAPKAPTPTSPAPDAAPAPTSPAPDAAPASPAEPAPAPPAEPAPAPSTEPAPAPPASAAEPAPAPPASAAEAATPPPVREPTTRAVPPAGSKPTKPSAADQAQRQQANSYDEPGTEHLVEEEKKGPGNFMVVPQIEATFALGQTAQFAGPFGIGGFGIDARYLGFRPWRLGGSVSWQSIAQRKEDQSVTTSQATYSGTMIKELSYNPLLAKVGYTISEAEKLRTYASFGLGATRSLRRIDTGIVALVDEQWHFTLAPEAGLEIPIGPVHIVVSGRLSYLTPAASLSEQWLFNLCLGVGFD